MEIVTYIEVQRSVAHFPLADRVVAIATSTGGLLALRKILAVLPRNFPAAIVVVQHFSIQFPTCTIEMLGHSTALYVKQAEQGDRLHRGTVYIAPPGTHVLVNPDGTISLSDVATMNFVCPAADKLFTSLAMSYQAKAIGVVLTGQETDGLLGVLALKRRGGILIAQDEATCDDFGMSKRAINMGKVDRILPLNAIAPTLLDLVWTRD